MAQPANLSPVSELARILVNAALSSITDIYSVEALSDQAGLSRRAFHNRCQAAGVAGRDCLRFVQCLKAILAADDHSWDPVLAAVVNTTVVAVENLTVGSTVWLPAESSAPGR